MRKMLGHTTLGENGTLYFWKEDEWIYPEVTIDVNNGESASISLQHMSPKQLLKLSDDIKEIARLADVDQVLEDALSVEEIPPPEIPPPGMPW